jgi:tRNA (guanine10-N2)-dimethyltransferase
MQLLFELSGEHPTLPVAELESVGTVQDHSPQVAVADCPDPSSARRLALTHAVMEYLGSSSPSPEGIASLLRDLALAPENPFSVRVKKAEGSSRTASQPELERLMGSLIAGKVSLAAPVVEYRALISGDRCYLGRLLFRIDRASYTSRDPLRRPFFHPGVMLPRFARAVVNLTLLAPGEFLFDPFCGTGGFLLEAELLGARVAGGDADPAMVAGSRMNLRNADLMRLDAGALPLCSGSVDAVATDLPYGQSSWIRGRDLDRLTPLALREIARVLGPGQRAAIVAHRDIRPHVPETLAILQHHEQRVHRSLTRRYLVLERKVGKS